MTPNRMVNGGKQEMDLRNFFSSKHLHGDGTHSKPIFNERYKQTKYTLTHTNSGTKEMKKFCRAKKRTI